MGHKPDDHEETPQQDMGGMTMGGKRIRNCAAIQRKDLPH